MNKIINNQQIVELPNANDGIAYNLCNESYNLSKCFHFNSISEPVCNVPKCQTTK